MGSFWPTWPKGPFYNELKMLLVNQIQLTFIKPGRRLCRSPWVTIIIIIGCWWELRGATFAQDLSIQAMELCLWEMIAKILDFAGLNAIVTLGLSTTLENSHGQKLLVNLIIKNWRMTQFSSSKKRETNLCSTIETSMCKQYRLCKE